MKTKMHNGHMVVDKPWGQYIHIHREENGVFKKITVSPGEEISLQTHNLRDECWYINSGNGKIIVGTEVFFIQKGNSFFIRKKTKHQVFNTGKTNLDIYEMQMGVCDEGDIIRHEDKYGRTT